MNGSQPEPPTFFIDRNAGGHSFRDLLKASGLNVVLHDDEFPRTAADQDWLLAVGSRNWIVVTGDKAITSSPLFLKRLAESRTFVFIVYRLNGATPEGKAQSILDASETMIRLTHQRVPPAVWRIGKDGKPREFDFRRVLAQRHRSRRV